MLMLNSQKPIMTVAPTSSPLTLSEVKSHLRVDHSDEDALIAGLMQAAVSHLDGYSGVIGRCLTSQTWQISLSCFPSGDIRLPFPDVQSVTVSYKDTEGDDQTFTGFELYADAISSVLTTASGEAWPSTDDTMSAVTITMVCGYGDADDVPYALKVAMLMHIASMYENRESTGEKAISNTVFDGLVAPYRRGHV